MFIPEYSYFKEPGDCPSSQLKSWKRLDLKEFSSLERMNLAIVCPFLLWKPLSSGSARASVLLSSWSSLSLSWIILPGPLCLGSGLLGQLVNNLPEVVLAAFAFIFSCGENVFLF